MRIFRQIEMQRGVDLAMVPTRARFMRNQREIVADLSTVKRP